MKKLKNKIDGIWDIFWSSGMTNPLTVIEQITYLMFIKILDDNEVRKEAKYPEKDEEWSKKHWMTKNYELIEKLLKMIVEGDENNE